MVTVLNKVDDLICLLNDAELLGAEKRRALHRRFVNRVVPRMVEEGVSYNRASDGPAIYDQDYQAFRLSLKETDQNLDWQCDTVRNAFSRHLETGEIPPPYFPMRVAILLRKAKETERERLFLVAWCRHFGNDHPSSGKYFKLTERARKMRAI